MRSRLELAKLLLLVAKACGGDVREVAWTIDRDTTRIWWAQGGTRAIEGWLAGRL